MRILLVNPNTTVSMTEQVVAAGRRYAAPDVEVVGATSVYGPPSIEGYYDEIFAVPPMLEIIDANRDDVDGVIVACFDDTGVDAARCLVDVPVIGICQAAMQTASVLAGSFSVITTLSRSIPALEHLAHRYGFERRCRKVRAADVPVLDLEQPSSGAEEKICREIEAALDEDGAEAIVLGCAGMVDLAARLTRRYDVPVLEGVAPALKIIEGLAGLGLRSSRRGGYAPPRAKAYTGEFAKHSPKELE